MSNDAVSVLEERKLETCWSLPKTQSKSESILGLSAYQLYVREIMAIVNTDATSTKDGISVIGKMYRR